MYGGRVQGESPLRICMVHVSAELANQESNDTAEGVTTKSRQSHDKVRTTDDESTARNTEYMNGHCKANGSLIE